MSRIRSTSLATIAVLAGCMQADARSRRPHESAAAIAAVLDGAVLPDPTVTPGAVDEAVTLSDICNGTTRTRRRVSPSARADALAGYDMSATGAGDNDLDHLVPLALGGANVVANLWPQPSPEAHLKDVLEVEMQRRACVAYRTLMPDEAAAAVLRQERREIADDWVSAYRRYVGGR